MTVKIFPNFLSSDECQTLNQIALQGVEEGWVDKALTVENGNSDNPLRKSSRGYMCNGEDYPQFVKDVSKRIRTFMNIDSYPPIVGGRYGVIVSVMYQGGDLFEHKDGGNGAVAYRCNIMTQANEDGGDLYLSGKKVDVRVGDLHCYAASEFPHYATTAKGPTPRIMWMFGAYVPRNVAVERGYI